ncbi:uncharacterized protein LOC132313107 [Cornus florida]|uniref:uncharacterized protein LOC132313107 n=1 Tax=Cornus florida TaxID=4283 RepID=UPI0028974DD9|nr:uncharacterized protein LOC132313107 [Cornus florida]
MMSGVNADVKVKLSEKKMEGDDALRTVECLRGRLQAERVASRLANDKTEQLGKKLIELENQLRIEIKSRNKAEKKLKFLMKKLNSLNISYVSEESEHSSMFERSDMSSVSSTASSSTKEPKTQITSPTKCDNVGTIEKPNCPMVSNLKHSEESLSSSASEPNSDKYSKLESSRKYDDSKRDDQSFESSIEEKEINGENDGDQNSCVDNSLAIVPYDLPIESSRSIEPESPIVNASVKDVLDALRHAREKIQSSMQRRHMIKVG